MEYDLLIQRILIGNGYTPGLAKIFAAVSRHETGNYTSAVLRKYNNLFGMKDAKVRQTTNRTDKDDSDYAEYRSAADSVRDLALWLDAVNFPRYADSPSDVVTEMKNRRYFEAPYSKYLEGVERALNRVVPYSFV